MHFSAGKTFSEKKRLFLKKSNVRFFQKQPLFFGKRPPCEKLHIYAKRAKPRQAPPKRVFPRKSREKPAMV
jgi:hypothetical protein